MAYKISECTKKNLSACLGVPFEKIVTLSPEEEIQLASRKNGRPVVFSKKRNRNRSDGGEPLLAGRKIRTIQEIDRKIAKIK